MRPPSGWTPTTSTPQSSYDYDRHGQESANAVVWLARLAKQDGFTDPQSAVNLIMTCLMPNFTSLPGAQIQGVQINDESTQVDGHNAWHRQTKVSWTLPNARADSGFQIDVIVVDLGQGRDYLGEYFSLCLLDAATQQQQLSNALSTLTVID